MSEPVAYFCPHGCGCLWRENLDGSMSLYGRNSKSCEKCERLPLNSLLPLYSFDTIVALLNERDALMSLIRDEIDENARLRDLGGAAADEGITAMIERVIAERDVLARDAAYWKEEARRYCENADFWRERATSFAMKGASDE